MIIESKLNRRVLVVDDEEAIRDSFALVLCPSEGSGNQADAAAAALFDDEPPVSQESPSRDAEFEVSFAINGREALAAVTAALGEGKPYAVVFCDMRMPGWDGLETIEHIRAVDPRCEIVFVTAYSDHNVESITERVGGDVGYFLKPFANEELRQMAVKAVLDWNRARELEQLLSTVTSLRGEVDDINRVLQYLLGQICEWLHSDSAALVQLSGEGEAIFRLGVGRLATSELDVGSLSHVVDKCIDKPYRLENGTTYLPIRQYGLAVAMDCPDKITPDKEYMLRVFLEHASMAIRNSEMHSQLVKSEQLAAVGEALGFILHDLRNPLGNIQELSGMFFDPEGFGITREEVKELMDESVKSTMDLLNDTLEFSRGAVTVDPVQGTWSELLGRKLELMRLDLEKKHVALVVDAPADLALFLDPGRMFRAIRNLCKNAGEALESERRTDGRVTIGACAQEGFTEIWVADNGAGIPAEVKKKLFQPFATQGKAGGTGFGLAIAKQLVEAHRGEISVNSSDAGTRFTIQIPAAPAAT